MTEWNDESQDLLDNLIRRLEEAWRSGGEVDLSQFVPSADHPLRGAALVALIQVDQELRWRHGKGKTVEEYLTEWPELQSQGEQVAELQAAEDELRAEITTPRPAVEDGMAPVETADWLPGDTKSTAPCKEGDRLGHYRIIRPLGCGGMGWVYLAHDEELDKPVAVKVPHRHLFQSDIEIMHFLEEARVAAKLRHPAIVPIHYFGREPDGTCYIVMEFIEGHSLADRIKSGPLVPAEAVEMLASIADTVSHIHEQRLVHRDLKPQNILLDKEGRPHVADFGLALHESTQRRMAGNRSGTLLYMSPEQVAGKAHWLDGRADLWALGVMFYEMLTGQRPFCGEARKEIEDEILYREPKPPRQVDFAIPAQLESVCLKCLSKNVAGRFATAHDLASALRDYKSTESCPNGRAAVGKPHEADLPCGRSAFARLNIGRVGCAVSLVFSLFIAVIVGTVVTTTLVVPASSPVAFLVIDLPEGEREGVTISIDRGDGPQPLELPPSGLVKYSLAPGKYRVSMDRPDYHAEDSVVLRSGETGSFTPMWVRTHFVQLRDEKG